MTPHRTLDVWIRNHPGKVDGALAIGLWLLLTLSAFLLGGFSGQHRVLEFIIGSLQVLPLIWRRSHLLLSSAAVVLGCLAQVTLLLTFLPSQLTVPIVVFTLAKYGKRWASYAGLGAGMLGAVLATLRFGNPTGQAIGLHMLPSLVGLALIVLVAWTFGDLARTRRLAMQALSDRASRLEIERQQERDLAASDERGRIAREMHDIVAHSLSVIITQADGARYASEHDLEVARETLGTISETGRKSLREMRRLLGVLRGDEQASTRPLPTLADIDWLLDETRTAGLEVTSTLSGSPRRELPPGAELTAYRAIQEALTNTIKHAGPAASSEVHLEWTSTGLEVEVTDDGRGAAATEENIGARQGLIGMAERVALYDGRIETGPRSTGGFSARIFIPYTED
ncbi:sensor histidine kinase [Arthrobacter rhombi]|uniref:sensor histidine kinase n=1 Tax=Arthrobacter rhombi TaxID=71253 RepID=UPI003FD13F7C